MTAIPTETPAAPMQGIGLVDRLKNAEPVRLYVYGLALLAILGLQLAGALTGEWVQYSLTASATVLGVAGAGAEAARASVYSPAGAIRELRRVRDTADVRQVLS
jgi:hypothetical protein